MTCDAHDTLQDYSLGETGGRPRVLLPAEILRRAAVPQLNR